MVPKIGIDKNRIAAFCHRWKVAEFSLFGSVLRSDFGPESDVDVLVAFQANVPWSLYDWLDMRDELRDLFGRQVDLVSKRALRNPFRRHEILTNRVVLYAA